MRIPSIILGISKSAAPMERAHDTRYLGVIAQAGAGRPALARTSRDHVTHEFPTIEYLP